VSNDKIPEYTATIESKQKTEKQLATIPSNIDNCSMIHLLEFTNSGISNRTYLQTLSNQHEYLSACII